MSPQIGKDLFINGDEYKLFTHHEKLGMCPLWILFVWEMRIETFVRQANRNWISSYSSPALNWCTYGKSKAYEFSSRAFTKKLFSSSRKSTWRKFKTSLVETLSTFPARKDFIASMFIYLLFSSWIRILFVFFKGFSFYQKWNLTNLSLFLLFN